MSSLKKFFVSRPRLWTFLNDSLLRIKAFMRVAELLVLISVLQCCRLFCEIRVARFRSEKIGHFISESDLAIIGSLDKWRSNHNSRPQRDLFVMPSGACNEQVRQMYIRSVRSMQGPTLLDCRESALGRLLLRPTESLTQAAQLRGRHIKFFGGAMNSGGLVHVGLVSRHMPHLALTQEEIAAGWRQVQAIGIDPGHKLVCIHIRDDAYLAAAEPGRDWRYHDYRNPCIENYLPAIRWLLTEGYKVIRMGRVAARPLEIEHSGFVDYAFSPLQSDFLDVFLYSQAHLSIAGSASGIDNLGYAFHTPTILVDLVPFHPQQANPGLVITPCLLRNTDSGRLLPLSDMRDHQYLRSEQYDLSSLTVMRSSPEEILATIQEGTWRRDGLYIESEEDRALQASFWSWFDECGFNDGVRIGPQGSSYYKPFIGNSFLRNHLSTLLT